jgi:hypothetical protein
MSDCGICCETFTGTRRAKVSCGGCDFAACVQCTQTYILSKEMEPHCMGCKEPFDPNFMIKHFSKTWRLKDLKNHREKILLDREKLRKPEIYSEEMARRAQHEIDQVRWFYHQGFLGSRRPIFTVTYTATHEKTVFWKLACFNRENLRDALQIWVVDWKQEYDKLKTDHLPPDVMAAYIYLGKMIEMDLMEHPELVMYRDWWEEKRHAVRSRYPFEEGYRRTRNPHKVVYNRPCPLEECNGFVDTSKWVCGTCKKHICKECFSEKDEVHECNKDMVETVKMIMKESRPCPKCSIYIHKTEGCDQMWCTQCHTTFSYQTGEIHVGRTHNPMYYQWLRETRGTVPREPGDDPNQHCMTDPTVMLTKLTRINTDHEEERAIIGKVEGVVRLKAELQRGATWNMPWYHRENYTNNLTGTGLRRLTVDSIDGKIRDADWKHRIQMIDKRTVRDQLFRDCMDTFVAVSSEMVEEFWNHWRTRGTVDMTFGNKLDGLMNYVNGQFGVYSKAMNIVAPRLEMVRQTQEWRVEGNKIRY